MTHLIAVHNLHIFPVLGIYIDEADDETLGFKVGAELIKQAANKMNDLAGDGTTTVTVLTYHILNEANKLMQEQTAQIMLLRESNENKIATDEILIDKLDTLIDLFTIAENN